MAGINREKLQKQLSKARGIVRVERMNGRTTSKTFIHASRIVIRTEKLLGRGGAAKPKAKKGSLSEGARGVLELVERASKMPGKIKKGLKSVEETTKEAASSASDRPAKKKPISRGAYEKHYGRN
jgi:hypothetical protein